MTFFEQYSIYFQELILLVTTVVLVIGSVIVFKSKRTKSTWVLLISSVMLTANFLPTIYINIKASGLLDNSINDNFSFQDNFEDLMKLMNYSRYVYILFSTSFALAFVSLCCSVASLRKRNEELEFLTKELAERD